MRYPLSYRDQVESRNVVAAELHIVGKYSTERGEGESKAVRLWVSSVHSLFILCEKRNEWLAAKGLEVERATHY